MNKIKSSGFFRVISMILIITFISLDIAYAYPPEHTSGNSTLAAPSLLQQQPINEHTARFQRSVFSEWALLDSVYDIGEYFFGKPERKMEPLPSKYAEEVVRAGRGKILGDSGIEILNIVPVEYLKETTPEKLSSSLIEIGFKGILPDEGVVFILYKKDGKEFLVQIAEKAKVSAANLPGYEWPVSDKYVVKLMPEVSMGGKTQPTASLPVIAISPSISPLDAAKEEPKATIRDFSGKTYSFEPFSVMLGATGALSVLLWLKDFAFAHPVLAGAAVLGIGIATWLTIWRIFFPLRWHLYRGHWDALVAIGAPAVPALIKILEGYNNNAGHGAAEALGKIGLVTPEVVPALIKALKYGDDYTRWFAAEALGKIGLATPEVISVLTKAVEDSDQRVCMAAAEALGKIGLATPEVISVLTKAVYDSGRHVRRNAAEALEKLGALPVELKIKRYIIDLNEADRYPQDSALRNLAFIGYPAIKAALSSQYDTKMLDSVKRHLSWRLKEKINETIMRTSYSKPAWFDKKIDDKVAAVAEEFLSGQEYEVRLVTEQRFVPGSPAGPVEWTGNRPVFWVDEVPDTYVTSLAGIELIPIKTQSELAKSVDVKDVSRKDAPNGEQGGSTTLMSINPLAAIFSVAALDLAFSAVRDFAFAYPIITFGVALIVGIKAAFIVWRKLSPMTYYMNGLSPTAIFQSGTKAKSALIEMGEQAVPYLMKSLRSEDKYNESIRREVIEILGEIRGARTVEPLVEALRGRRFSSTFGAIDAAERALEEIGKVAEIKKEDKDLAQLGTARVFKATQLFELIESSLNNERAKFIDEGNKLIRSLIATTGTEALAGIGILDRNMATTKISQRVERTIAAINSLDKEDVAPGTRVAIESLKKNLRQLEADGGVGSLIVLARNAKKEDQKLIIGLETDWIPGINVENSLQRQAITALVKEIDGIAEALQSMGLDNVEVIRGSGEKLANALLSEADKTHTNLRNIVVMASTSTINSGSFASLKNADENDRPFLAGIDPTELIKLYEEFGEDSSNQLYIRLTDLLYMTLELAAGKEPPQTPMIVSYDRKLRMVIFLPRAEPMDYEALKNNYKAEKTALQAA